MRSAIQTVVIGGILAGLACAAAGQEPRLANGLMIQGTIAKITAEGLEMDTPRGPKVYAWETLSPATRFRHDPVYRHNFEAILQGLPRSARTAPPVQSEPSQAPEIPEGGLLAEERPPTQATGSLELVDQVLYQNIQPFSVASFPDLALRTPKTAAFWGLQYGPGSKEVVYVAFDAKGAEDLRDTIYIYSPGHPAYQTTIRQKALKKKVGNEYIASFKDIELTSQFGQINVKCDVRFTYRAGERQGLNALIDVLLAVEDAKSRFVLGGEPTDLIYGEGVINVRGILDLPVLWVGLDPTSPEPRLVGDLKMSRMKLCPKRGMETEVEVEVIDEATGQAVEATSVKLGDQMFQQEYGIIADLRAATPGQRCTVRAGIDLGPFLGRAACEERITVPARRAQ